MIVTLQGQYSTFDLWWRLFAHTLELPCRWSYRLIISAVLIIGTHFNAIPQQPNFRHYGVDDGLPSSAIFHVVQDQDGYIWMATDKGVSRYNGSSFVNYSTFNGLPSNTVFHLHSDGDGSIWFNHFNKELSVYRNGQITAYQHTALLSKWLGEDKVNSIYLDQNKSLWLGISTKDVNKACLIHISANGILKEVAYSGEPGTIGIKQFFDGQVVIGTNSYTKSGEYQLLAIRPKDTVRKKLPFNPFKNHRVISACAINQNETAFCAGKRIITIGSIGTIKSRYLGETTNSLMKGREGNIWVGLSDGGVLELDEQTLLTKRSMLNDYVVTSIWIDHEGGYWFATHDDGVFYSGNMYLSILNESHGLPDNRFSDLVIRNDTLWIGHRSGYLSIVENEKVISSSKIGTYLGHIATTTGQKLVLCGGNLKSDSYPNATQGPYSLASASDIDGHLWMGGTNGLVAYNKESKSYNRVDDEFKLRVEALSFYNDTLWIGTIDGLYFKVQNQRISRCTNRLLVACKRITQMLVFKDRLVIATQSSGLKQNLNGQWSSVNNGPMGTSNLIDDLYPFGDTLWVSTNQGISCLPFSKGTFTKSKTYSVYHGLPTKEIGSLAVTAKGIWFTSHLGIGYIPYRRFNKEIAPKVIMSAVIFPSKEIPLVSNYRMEHRDNQLRIAFEGIGFRWPGSMKFEYRFPPLHNQWVPTHQEEIQFNSLKPDAYIFEVRALTPNGTESVETAGFELYIEKALWQTIGFRISILLFILCGLWASVWSYTSRMRQRNELEQQLEKLTNSALRRLMNPHFVYNSLNTIQSFISKNDRKNSMKYLSRFSRLMRKVFQNSEKENISLKEELETAHLYVSLESQRRRRMISLITEFSHGLSPDMIYVPPLFLQPFIENAVIHGILPSAVEEGLIQLSISKHGKNLRFNIINNGLKVDRDRSGDIDENGQEGERHGLALTLSRIRNFNKRFSKNLALNFICKPNGTAPVGTLIAFNLALLWSINKET